MAARARGLMGSVGLEAGLAAELAGRCAAEPEVGRCSLWGAWLKPEVLGLWGWGRSMDRKSSVSSA